MAAASEQGRSLERKAKGNGRSRKSAKPDSIIKHDSVTNLRSADAAPVARQTIADKPTPGHYGAQAMDRAFKANLARMTNGISPAGLAGVYFEWLSHLALSPGKQMELGEKALRKNARLVRHSTQMSVDGSSTCIEPLPQDRRFSGDAWKQWPYSMMSQAFLLNQQWWHNATTDIDGLSPDKERVIEFVSRQLLDIFAPTNFLFTNPELNQATMEQGGMNLVRGMQNLVADVERTLGGKPPAGAEAFEVGRNLATTPGKVVFRNHLIELIQYSPTTDKVYAQPVLIVPAWIMKYYILDLSEYNSLVKYLVDQGHTVFMISWRNPDSDDRDLGMDDYLKLGPMSAIDAVSAIVPGVKIHATGYCLGGTLVSIAAAAMARDGDDRLASLTTFATQVDFTEPGELSLFISESEVSWLENMMWEQGYLDGYQMAGSFQLLRSNDLIWSRMLHDYLLGERTPMNDLMAWNADLTRMPYRMHSEYLRKLFLGNELATGQFHVDHRPVAISDIRAPIFAVGTVKDHVAPWHSAYKIHLLADSDEITFVLTSGGHNAGVVSEPGHPRRSYQISTHAEGERYIDPDAWQQTTPTLEGSWWPAWCDWLAEHSSGEVAVPAMGAKAYPPLEDAPGTYVYQK